MAIPHTFIAVTYPNVAVTDNNITCPTNLFDQNVTLNG